MTEKLTCGRLSTCVSCAAGAYCTYRCGGRWFEYTHVTYDTSAR